MTNSYSSEVNRTCFLCTHVALTLKLDLRSLRSIKHSSNFCSKSVNTYLLKCEHLAISLYYEIFKKYHYAKSDTSSAIIINILID